MQKGSGSQGQKKEHKGRQDCLNGDHIGRSIVITLANGRTESGILRALGMYDIKLELTTKKELIVFKHALVTVSVL